MALTVFLGKTIKDYLKNSREYIDRLLAERVHCVLCRGVMGYHGYYERTIKDNNVEIWIHRICCRNPECRHTEAILPDFLIPCKHYSADEIEYVLLEEDNTTAETIETEASVPTIRRWVRQIREKICSWIAVLTQLAGEVAAENEIQSNDLLIIERLGLVIEALPSIHKCGNILGAALIHISNRIQGCFYT